MRSLQWPGSSSWVNPWSCLSMTFSNKGSANYNLRAKFSRLLSFVWLANGFNIFKWLKKSKKQYCLTYDAFMYEI